MKSDMVGDEIQGIDQDVVPGGGIEVDEQTKYADQELHSYYLRH